MRIVAASDIALSSPRAHAINVVKTAGGFARLGHRVTLVVADDGSPRAHALAALGESELVVETFQPNERLSHTRRGEAFAARTIEVARTRCTDLLYARHFQTAVLGARAGIPTVLETHAYIGDTNPLLIEAFAATRSRANPLTIVTISHRLRACYATLGADPARIAIVPDGVDLNLFTPPADPGPSPFPPDLPRPIVLHAGHLYDHKGIPAMLEAAALLGDVSLALLGGTDEDIARVRAQAASQSRVRVLGRVAHTAVPAYLWHADALVLVPSALEPSKDWTSPVKLGEYLASGTPTIASSIPALRDWLDTEVRWCMPDDAVDLARAIRNTLSDKPDDLRTRRIASRTLAQRLSYPRRADSILRAVGVGAPALVETDEL